MGAVTPVELLHVSTLWRLERGLSRDGRSKLLVRRPRNDSASRRAELRHEFGIRKRLPQGITLYPQAIERRDSGLVLVYDDVPGQPLAARKTQRWQPDEVDVFARRAAEALVKLHSAGVIHGGLHPGSIFVGEDNSVRFTEFTTAGIVSQATVVDETSRIGAELAYVAPEQTGRMNRPIDQRCDLYALGVILYELLSGAPPFVSDDPLELIHSHMTAKPAPLRGHDKRSRGLAAVIHRLLAKEPADRLDDAKQLLAALSSGEQAHRATRTLRLPETLYGREREATLLREAFSRVTNGVCVLALVSGSAGAGKSSLVFETLRPVGTRDGLFVAGTCDPLRRGAPFAAIFDVARGLIQYVLTLKNDAVEQWRARMEQTMGPFLPVLTAAIIDAIALFGELEDPAPLPPADTQRRLERTLQRFITVFARAQRPLIVFLDDMQWVDAASLRLIESMLYDAADLHLLVVGASRNEAVDPKHRLTPFFERCQQLPTPPVEVSLGPLDEGSIRALLHDALGFGKVDGLVDELILRTGGNPLFVREFLRFLDRQRLLHYDTARAAWELHSLSSAVLPDSVAELLGAELRQLPHQTQRVLQHAACIGMRFETQALAELMGWTLTELHAALAPALELDLLVAQGPGNAVDRLRFIHDRIRQEAFAPLDHASRGRIHATIGRRLYARAGDV
ncbi:MAG: ATP-binding protein, partial [Nannocystaceae bacterium]